MRVIGLTFGWLFFASSVFAQSSLLDVEPTGSFSLGYRDQRGSGQGFLVGDTTLRFSGSDTASGSLPRFGFEIGLYGRADDQGNTPHETYGALTYDLGRGRVSLGVPRPAYDGFAISALEGPFPSLGVDRVFATRSAATSGAMFLGWVPYGASYQTNTGALDFGLSVHAVSGGTTIVGGGVSTVSGAWTFSAAVESADGAFNAKAQALRAFDQGQAGITYFASGAPGTSDIIELFAEAQPLDRIGITGVAQLPMDGGSATGGVSARYAITDNSGVSLGVFSDAGSDPGVNAFLDFQF